MCIISWENNQYILYSHQVTSVLMEALGQLEEGPSIGHKWIWCGKGAQDAAGNLSDGGHSASHWPSDLGHPHQVPTPHQQNDRVGADGPQSPPSSCHTVDLCVGSVSLCATLLGRQLKANFSPEPSLFSVLPTLPHTTAFHFTIQNAVKRSGFSDLQHAPPLARVLRYSNNENV